jgi:hypothetical protein
MQPLPPPIEQNRHKQDALLAAIHVAACKNHQSALQAAPAEKLVWGCAGIPPLLAPLRPFAPLTRTSALAILAHRDVVAGCPPNQTGLSAGALSVAELLAGGQRWGPSLPDPVCR